MNCLKCLKYLVFTFNLIFWILGMAVFGIAIWLRLDRSNVEYVVVSEQSIYYIVCYILMGAGALMSFIGFLGCCGAYRENRCMLTTFFICLTLILLTEIAAGVCAIIYQQKIESGLNTSLKQFVVNDYGYEKKRTEAMDRLQQELSCCGASGYIDYSKSTFATSNARRTQPFPDSCCEDNHCSSNNYFQQGCSAAIVSWFQDHLVIVIIVGFTVGFIEILGMVLSMTLCCLIHRRYDGYYK